METDSPRLVYTLQELLIGLTIKGLTGSIGDTQVKHLPFHFKVQVMLAALGFGPGVKEYRGISTADPLLQLVWRVHVICSGGSSPLSSTRFLFELKSKTLTKWDALSSLL